MPCYDAAHAMLQYGTVSAVLQGIAEASPGAPMLFDMSLERTCPALLADVRIPRLCPVDLMSLLPRDSAFGCAEDGSHQWPSLFVAPAGSATTLHVDTYHMRFWMALLKGRKRWVTFPPEHVHDLMPADSQAFPSRFKANLLSLNSTAQHRVRYAWDQRWEGVLNAGDILFLPEGWVHQVHNLDLTIAVAGNFVDRFSYQAHLGWLAYHALTMRDPARRNSSIAMLRAYNDPGFAENKTKGFQSTPRFKLCDTEKSVDPSPFDVWAWHGKR